MSNTHPKIMGFVGYSGAGKTTLIVKLIPRLQSEGLKCAVIKSTHHNIEIDKPGKDSYRYRQVGAKQIILASPQRQIIVSETPRHETTLQDQLHWIDTKNIDLVLVEGFKHAMIDKIEIHSEAQQKPYLFPNDPYIIALASDIPPIDGCNLPQYQRDNTDSISQFIINRFKN